MAASLKAKQRVKQLAEETPIISSRLSSTYSLTDKKLWTNLLHDLSLQVPHQLFSIVSHIVETYVLTFFIVIHCHHFARCRNQTELACNPPDLDLLCLPWSRASWSTTVHKDILEWCSDFRIREVKGHLVVKARLASGRDFSYIFNWRAAFRLSHCTLICETGQCSKPRSRSSP